jgi:carbon storage regulator
MLILSRHAGETIVISHDIKVTVLGVKGSQVRLGVEAPRGVPVDRLEIAVRKAGGPLPAPGREATAEQQSASCGSGEPLFANRTEQEWRQLLAAEAKEKATGEPS